MICEHVGMSCDEHVNCELPKPNLYDPGLVENKNDEKEGPVLTAPEKGQCDPSQTMQTPSTSIFEEPQRLIFIDPTSGKLCLNDTVVKKLRDVTQSLHVVTVAGLFRTGKSYLMQRLAGKHSGFPPRSVKQGNTEGIWAMCADHPVYKHHALLVLDTHGIEDLKQGNTNNKMNSKIISTLAMLLSSILIYNNIETIDEASLCREIVEVFKNELSPDEYLEHCLSVERKNEDSPRLYIRKSFKRMKSFKLERQKTSDESIHSDLSPDTIEDIDSAVRDIHHELKPMELQDGTPVTGRIFCELANSYIDTINQGEMPYIEETPWSKHVTEDTSITEERSLDEEMFWGFFSDYLQEEVLERRNCEMHFFDDILGEERKHAFEPLRGLVNIRLRQFEEKINEEEYVGQKSQLKFRMFDLRGCNTETEENKIFQAGEYLRSTAGRYTEQFFGETHGDGDENEDVTSPKRKTWVSEQKKVDKMYTVAIVVDADNDNGGLEDNRREEIQDWLFTSGKSNLRQCNETTGENKIWAWAGKCLRSIADRFMNQFFDETHGNGDQGEKTREPWMSIPKRVQKGHHGNDIGFTRLLLLLSVFCVSGCDAVGPQQDTEDIGMHVRFIVPLQNGESVTFLKCEQKFKMIDGHITWGDINVFEVHQSKINLLKEKVYSTNFDPVCTVISKDGYKLCDKSCVKWRRNNEEQIMEEERNKDVEKMCAYFGSYKSEIVLLVIEILFWKVFWKLKGFSFMKDSRQENGDIPEQTDEKMNLRKSLWKIKKDSKLALLLLYAVQQMSGVYLWNFQQKETWVNRIMFICFMVVFVTSKISIMNYAFTQPLLEDIDDTEENQKKHEKEILDTKKHNNVGRQVPQTDDVYVDEDGTEKSELQTLDNEQEITKNKYRNCRENLENPIAVICYIKENSLGRQTDGVVDEDVKEDTEKSELETLDDEQEIINDKYSNSGENLENSAEVIHYESTQDHFEDSDDIATLYHESQTKGDEAPTEYFGQDNICGTTDSDGVNGKDGTGEDQKIFVDECSVILYERDKIDFDHFRGSEHNTLTFQKSNEEDDIARSIRAGCTLLKSDDKLYVDGSNDDLTKQHEVTAKPGDPTNGNVLFMTYVSDSVVRMKMDRHLAFMSNCMKKWEFERKLRLILNCSSLEISNASCFVVSHIELPGPCGSSIPLLDTGETGQHNIDAQTEDAEEELGVEKPDNTGLKDCKQQWLRKHSLRIKVKVDNEREEEELSLQEIERPLKKFKDPRLSLQQDPFSDLTVRGSRIPTKKGFDAVCDKKELFGSVWGFYDSQHLPVPKVDITVAFKQAAEIQVQSNPPTNPNFEPLDAIIKKIADDEAPGPQITMRYEWLRICTLRNYPKDNKPWLTKLAAAGFYYAADGDEVICYCCGLRRHSWVSTDVPERIHQRINPNCKFLNRNVEFNVPIKYEGTTPNQKKIESLIKLLEEESVPAAITNGAEGGGEVTEFARPMPSNASKELKSPKHPQYVSRHQRISSFEGWPDNLTQTPEIMAEAGFYFAGFGDCVRCYYCGIGLRHWTPEDNPWIEHARWSQHCAFVKQVKGQEFINLVQQAVQVSQHNEIAGAAAANPSAESSERSQREQDEVERILRTDPAQSVLEMGYQPRIIKQAIDYILKREGKSGISSQKIMEKVLEYEDAESARDLVGELAHMDLNRQDSVSSGPASGASVKSGESKEISAKGASAQAREQPPRARHSHHSGELGRSNRDPNRPNAREIKEENQKLKEQTICKICLDNTVCIVFLPCGHLCTCDDCAPAMRTCPICRQEVKGTVKTFMS